MRELLDVMRRLKYCESLASYLDVRDWYESHDWFEPLLWRQLKAEVNQLIDEIMLLTAALDD